jgi:hypothetical protein
LVERARVYLSISGLGIIFYSPFAVRHIPAGEDYLEHQFLEPEDIARHVNACTLTGFGTGGPGEFELIVRDDVEEKAFLNAQFKAELCLEVRDEVVYFRDLYDLIRWVPECPANQAVSLPDGYYRVVAYTSYVPIGQSQSVTLSFIATDAKPAMHYSGVPELGG